MQSLPRRRIERPILFVDLDGTVREGKDDPLGRFVNGPDDVRVFPEAIIMMNRWRKGGGRIAAVSNQGGVALGLVSSTAVRAALDETQRQCHGLIDLIVWCEHHPNAGDRSRCWCRKPAPGLIFGAMYQLGVTFSEQYPPPLALMVGDRDEDRECAARAGVDFQWAAEWRQLAQTSEEQPSG